MNALFITGADFSDDTYGGPKGSYRNYLLLKEYFEVDRYVIAKKSTLRSGLSIAEGFFPPTDISDVKKIKKMNEGNKYEIVFLDGSIYGGLIKIFRQAPLKIIVFYHNCEHDYIAVRFGKKFSLKKWIYQLMNDKSERISSLKSDFRITFSLRDANRIEKIYGVNVQKQLPLSIVDNYQVREPVEHEKNCLLFGPAGTANIEAFGWFVKNVSPKLRCTTILAGKGFEGYREWENDKVSVIGFVEDISGLYNAASCVAIPLFSGGGMKVKTVEALMFGKSIFGTDEAFSGYDIDYERIGGLCNDADSFVEQINLFVTEDRSEYNSYARNLYETEYSVEASKRIFKEIMNELEIERSKK